MAVSSSRDRAAVSHDDQRTCANIARRAALMDTQPSIDPAAFSHIRVVLSMVVSLGIARLLSGVARFVQHPGRKRAYGVHLLWTLSLLLSMMHFRWWEFSLAHLPVWRFETYFFVVGYAALYYFLCAILFPDDLAEYTGYRDYFMSRRRWFFGLLATAYVVDVADTLDQRPRPPGGRRIRISDTHRRLCGAVHDGSPDRQRALSCRLCRAQPRLPRLLDPAPIRRDRQLN